MKKGFFRPKPFYGQQQAKIDKLHARINEQIKAMQVRVISARGEQIGIMPTQDAIALAREQNLDLIEVSPKADPPVAKLTSYDKYRYQQNKLLQQQRKNQKRVEVKGIRLSIRTGQHDLEFKARSADKFLKDRNKVKIDLILRGREKANVNYAIEQVNKFLRLISAPHQVELEPKKMGNMINCFLAPK